MISQIDLNIIRELQNKIKELEKKQLAAIQELNCIINEQVHRAHGCAYSEVGIDDLQSIIEILK